MDQDSKEMSEEEKHIAKAGDDREKVVSLLRQLGFITVARIQRVLGFSYNRAVKIVKELVDGDIIRPDPDLSFRYRAVDRVENEVKKGQ